MNHLTTKAASFKVAVLCFLVSLATMPGFAIAGGGGDFDPAAIITKVTTYTAAGVLILAAFALGRWTLRALGLIGGK